MIEVEQLTRNYDSFTAIDDLSFQVENGEVLGLVGPNGAGKTTTLRCIVGVLPPSSGDVVIDGCSIRKDPIEAKKRIGFMPDEPRLFEHLTLWEHLQFIARIYTVPDFDERARELVRELELAGKEGALPHELSRGMRQKLGIACGLLHAPGNLFFDEPLTGLDPIGIKRMKTTIRGRASAGASIIVSSHLLPIVEEICDRIMILNQGKKVALGSLDQIAAGIPGFRANPTLEEAFLRITDSLPDDRTLR